jgi:hypothetical protein
MSSLVSGVVLPKTRSTGPLTHIRLPRPVNVSVMQVSFGISYHYQLTVLARL